MSNTYSLDQLRSDLDREFAPLVIKVDGEDLVVRNVLRLHEEERNKALSLIGEFEKLENTEDAESVTKSFELVRELLLVLVKDGKGKKLIDAIDGDDALTMSVFNKWQKETQVGEA